RALKRVPAPVMLYRIVRASGGGRRSRARAPSPLVGRSEELDLLMRRWERARSGHGQFVQIVGEPGIGKSRLVEELHARLGVTPHTWVEWSSSQLLQNTPLHPVAEWGRQRFGDAETPASQRLAGLENTLQLIGLDPAEHAPLLAPLVDIPLPPGREANAGRVAEEANGGADRLGSGRGALAADCAGVRGPALGRPDVARLASRARRARRPGAAAPRRLDPSGVPPAL